MTSRTDLPLQSAPRSRPQPPVPGREGRRGISIAAALVRGQRNSFVPGDSPDATVVLVRPRRLWALRKQRRPARAPVSCSSERGGMVEARTWSRVLKPAARAGRVGDAPLVPPHVRVGAVPGGAECEAGAGMARPSLSRVHAGDVRSSGRGRLPEAGFLDAVTAAPAPTPEIIHVNKVAEAEPPNGLASVAEGVR